MNNRRTVRVNSRLDLMDYGPEPFVVNINKAANQNHHFRTALWTGNHFQFTLMGIPVGEEIGLESHPNLDLFLRIEDGYALVKMGNSADKLNYQKDICEGFAVFVPAGTWHNIINMGNKPVKLCVVCAPPQHAHGLSQATKTDAVQQESDAAEEQAEAVPQSDTRMSLND